MPANPEERDFASLRKFVRTRPRSTSPAEARCELCAADLRQDHAHLLETRTRRIVCSCTACAILFPGQLAARYRRIPRDIRLLADFALTDAQWDGFAIPINMAFFTLREADSAKPTVFYPSPAGATESALAIDSWQEMVEENPALRSMEPLVESLLVNRVTKPQEHYIVPIDECYRLVGLLRSQWRGFSGGTEVWQAIAAFFSSLKKRSILLTRGSHA